MRSLALVLVALLSSGCKKSTTADCGEAIAKGVDQLRERRKQWMTMRAGNLSDAAKRQADEQSKVMETFSAEQKTALTRRCTEDHWPADVIDCYEGATSPEAMRKCRMALPPAAAERARLDEVNLMGSAIGTTPLPAPDATRPVDGYGSAAAGSDPPK